MHFLPIRVNEEKIVKAIKKCDKREFELEMHFMQDFFSHYGQGFRALPIANIYNIFNHNKIILTIYL